MGVTEDLEALYGRIPSIIHLHKTDHSGDRPDSIEMGTPSKGGAVKVYFDASKPKEAEVLIAQAVHVAQMAAAIYKDSGLATKEAGK